MGPFSFLLTYTHTHMQHFIDTIGRKTFTALCVALFVTLFLLARHAFATEPTPEERAAAELPTVLREIERTQEYADRNTQARVRQKSILACLQAEDCTGF